MELAFDLSFHYIKRRVSESGHLKTTKGHSRCPKKNSYVYKPNNQYPLRMMELPFKGLLLFQGFSYNLKFSTF